MSASTTFSHPSASTSSAAGSKLIRWPTQKDVLSNRSIYGDPRGKNGEESKLWRAANITYVKPPWKMAMGEIPITRIAVNKACAASLDAILQNIWIASGKSQKKINQWGMNNYGGSLNHRLVRGGSVLSNHAYGAAIDFDPARNGMHDTTPYFAKVPEVVQAFKAQDWAWGGDWKSRPDAMHFEAIHRE